MATNFEPNECVIVVKSLKIGTLEIKANHSIEILFHLKTIYSFNMPYRNYHLHLVTYLDVGNFWDKSTDTTLHGVCVQVFIRFSASNRSSQSVALIYELAWLAGIRKSEENLPKTSCKVALVIKVAHIF